jgi:hypothetical protein
MRGAARGAAVQAAEVPRPLHASAEQVYENVSSITFVPSIESPDPQKSNTLAGSGSVTQGLRSRFRNHIQERMQTVAGNLNKK